MEEKLKEENQKLKTEDSHVNTKQCLLVEMVKNRKRESEGRMSGAAGVGFALAYALIYLLTKGGCMVVAPRNTNI